MAKILVTGGAGFIGSNLVDALIEKGHDVLVIDNLSTGKKENINPKAEFIEEDLLHFDKIQPLFKGVDFVFHEAALPRIPLSIEKPIETNDINIKGTLNALVAAKFFGVKKFIYAASSSALGSNTSIPMREDSQCYPLNPYALQKYVGELYCKIFSDIYGLPTVSLRYFNCYDNKTEVLTKDGFKCLKDITFNDEIATLKPETNNLEYHKPLAVQKYRHKGAMLNFNLESVDLMVTFDHNLYIKRKGKNFYLLKAHKILKEKGSYGWKMKQDCIWEGDNRNFEIIPSVKLEDGRQREEHSKKKIPIKLWLKFLGWFLSEGSVFSGVTTNYGKKVRYYRVTITQGNRKNYREILSLVKKIGFKPYLGSNKIDIIIHSKQLYQYLKKFEKNKHIPKDIKNLDRDLLKILFDTLMEGDGNKNGRRYTTKYKRFADDFQELLLKIGKVGKIVREKPHKNCKEIFRVYIKNKHFQPQIGDNYKKKLYLKKIEYNDFVYDLTVPNHIMLVRRNGKIVWSGNCYGPRQPREGSYVPVIGIFLTQKKNGEKLTITGDGNQTRDFTFISDVVRANILAMESDKVGKGEVINIGAGKNHSVNEIAEMVGGDSEYIPARPGEMQDTLADITRARELLGWQPEITLEEGIKKLLENE